MVIGSLVLVSAIAATGQVKLTNDDLTALELLGTDVTVTPVEIEPITNAVDWIPLKASTRQYSRRAGQDSTSTDTWTLSATDRAPGMPVGSRNGGWVITLVGRFDLHLDVGDAGIRVPTSRDVRQSVTSRFNPPRPLCLQGLEPGTPARSTSTVKVYDIHDPTVVAYSGSLDFTWTDLGGYRITVPAGTFDTHLVRIAFQGKVGAASIQNTQWMFLAKGTGMVAFIVEKNVSAVLIYNDDEQSASVLLPADQGSSGTTSSE